MTGVLISSLGYGNAQPSSASVEKRVIILAYEPISRPCGGRGSHILPGFKRVQDRTNTASLFGLICPKTGFASIA